MTESRDGMDLSRMQSCPFEPTLIILPPFLCVCVCVSRWRLGLKKALGADLGEEKEDKVPGGKKKAKKEDGEPRGRGLSLLRTLIRVFASVSWFAC